VNLLSGGEKALTAVSLIFAIFLIKPTPFCLLDEVDATLDEANVGRCNEIVREMVSAARGSAGGRPVGGAHSARGFELASVRPVSPRLPALRRASGAAAAR
jgi:hypothetical protein